MIRVRRFIDSHGVYAFVLLLSAFPWTVSAGPIEPPTQSENIYTLEMTLERAVFEFRMGADQEDERHPGEERALIALPQSQAYPLEIVEAEYVDSSTPSVAAPVLVWRMDDSPESEPPDKAEDLVEVKPLGTCRDLALARIAVRPMVSNRNGKERVEHRYRRLRLAIRFDPLEVVESSRNPDPGFQPILSKILLNPDVPDEWRITREALPAPKQEDLPDGVRGPYWKALAEGEGFFALPLDLLPKGVDSDRFDLWDRRTRVPRMAMSREELGTDSVVFYSHDDSVFSATNAVWIVPWGGARPGAEIPAMEPTDKAEPAAEAVFTDVYEEDLIFLLEEDKSECQAANWMWASFGSQDADESSGPFEWNVPLADLPAEATAVRFKIDLATVGRRATPSSAEVPPLDIHKCRFYLAGREILSGSYSVNVTDAAHGRNSIEFTQVVDPEIREKLDKTGSLDLRIEIEKPQPGEPEAVPGFLDRIEVTYRHRLTLRNGELRLPISCGSGPWRVLIPEEEDESAKGSLPLAFLMGDRDPLGSLKVTMDTEGKSFVVAGVPEEASMEAREIRIIQPDKIKFIKDVVPRRSTEILSPDMGADDVFIVYSDYCDDVSPLVRMHESLGLRVEVVTTEEIYDTFGDGTASPRTIKEFLRYAYRNWAFPPPRSVTLVGDATWDFKGRFKNGIVNQVPAYREPQKPRQIGTYASDHWYTCLEGDDLLPEISIGRIAVNTPERCRTVVEKITGGCAPKGPWRARMLFLSDKEPEFNREVKDFLALGLVPPDFERRWMRLIEFPFEDNFYVPESMMLAGEKKHSPSCNQALRDAIDKGILLWDFHGHGAPNVLGHERIFFGGGSKYTDVKKLKNGRMYPFFIGNTCDTARFDYAEDKWNVSLGEDLLQYPDGGCIAMILHTGRGYPNDHRVIDRMFQQAMFRFGLLRVGEINAAGKILYFLSDNEPEPVNMMVLLGDPWTAIPVPEGKLRVTATPDSVVEGREGTFQIRIEAAPSDEALAPFLDRAAYRAFVYVCDAEHKTILEHDEALSGAAPYVFEATLSRALPRGKGDVGVYFYPDAERAGLDLPDAVGSATFEVREDVEYAEELRARVREGGLPDLRIVRLETEPKDPVDGHTIWIHADVINDGTGLAGSVKIGGYWKERKEENRITTYRPLRQSLWTIDSLYPGEEKEGTLRWDPVRDAGDSELIVVVDPNSWIRESDDDNNSATAEIHVRRKGDLVIRKDSVVFMKDENAGKLKMGAVLVNDGESDVEQEFRIRTDAYKGDDPSEKPTSVYTTFLAEDGLIPFKYGTGRAFVVVLPLDTVRVTITIDEDDIVDEETHDNDRLEVRVKDHLK